MQSLAPCQAMGLAAAPHTRLAGCTTKHPSPPVDPRAASSSCPPRRIDVFVTVLRPLQPPVRGLIGGLGGGRRCRPRPGARPSPAALALLPAADATLQPTNPSAPPLPSPPSLPQGPPTCPRPLATRCGAPGPSPWPPSCSRTAARPPRPRWRRWPRPRGGWSGRPTSEAAAPGPRTHTSLNCVDTSHLTEQCSPPEYLPSTHPQQLTPVLQHTAHAP